MSRQDAAAAIDAGFAAVAAVHSLMSFHQAGSDVDRINCHALDVPVEVNPLTMRVMRCALQLAAASQGAFDVTVAGELVARGVLHRPGSERVAEPDCSWRDVELIGEDRVQLHRPLWIDLGGIAKGFAVDHALASMPLSPHAQVCVNAGGDLRVRGPGMQPVWLRVAPADRLAPVLMIHEGSVASSSGIGAGVAHVHGSRRTPMGEDSFVSVLAEECMLADALTKVVLAMPARADSILCSYGAAAHVYRQECWLTLGARA